MPRLLIIPVLLALAAVFWLWASGGFDQIAALAAQEQRDFQNQIARTLRALRGGEEGALALLMAACFAYGFFHAVGPGHGKVLIGGFGLGRKVSAIRLAAIGFAASIGQAITAVLLVYAGVLLLSLGREHMIGLTEDIMAPISYAAIALIGAWLILRGTRRLRFTQPPPPHDHDHDHDHDHHDHGAHDHHHHHHHGHEHDDTCPSCGHRHGPTIEEVAGARSATEILALIGSIAIRPCTGALFVLLITWQMGIPAAGIAGAFAMAIGTATVTVAVGLSAVGMRGGLVASLANGGLAARLIPVIEICAGLTVALVAGGLFLRALG